MVQGQGKNLTYPYIGILDFDAVMDVAVLASYRVTHAQGRAAICRQDMESSARLF